MVFKKLLLGLLTLYISSNGIAQNTPKKYSKSNSRIESKQQIKMLFDGVLLVRLKTRKSSIEALKKIGKFKKAKKYEKGQVELNKAIIHAFKNNFDFCPTYYFFSNESNKIHKGALDQVKFQNDSLFHDSNISVQTKNFLIAEFGNIAQDTAKYYDSYYFVENEKGTEIKPKYHGGSNFGFGALIIKSDQFIQLRKPFPYYVRTYNSLPIIRKPKKAVKKLNRKLYRYYNKQL